MEFRLNFKTYHDCKQFVVTKHPFSADDPQDEKQCSFLLENFKSNKEISNQMNEYIDLFNKEYSIIQKRKQILQNLKYKFERLSKEQYPEYYI